MADLTPETRARLTTLAEHLTTCARPNFCPDCDAATLAFKWTDLLTLLAEVARLQSVEAELARWKMCENCGEPLVRPGICAHAISEREKGLEQMHEETLTRAETAEAEVARLTAELGALETVLWSNGNSDPREGVTLLDRATNLVVQRQRDDERCRSWEAEVGVSDARYRIASERLQGIYNATTQLQAVLTFTHETADLLKPELDFACRWLMAERSEARRAECVQHVDAGLLEHPTLPAPFDQTAAQAGPR